MIYTTTSTEETIALGKRVATYLKPGDVILLDGDLGAGKTHFVKGLALGLGIDADVTSPTFTILNNYPKSTPSEPLIRQLNHFDVYRVNDEDEILDLGFEEMIYGEDISVIEWSSLIAGILPENSLTINIQHGNSPQERIITMNWSQSMLKRSLPNVDTCR